MIISPGRGYIFVHIPKTGGTSLALALEDRAMADDILIGDTPKAKRRKGRVETAQERAAGKLRKHSTLADLEGLVDPAEYFVVTLVRNPWDRMVSYYHWLREQNWEHLAVSAAKELSFKGFLYDPAMARSIQAWHYGSYLRDASGQEKCDLFIRLEHLGEDLPAFEEHLGFAISPLPRANISARRADYRGYYDDDTAAHVAALAASDIARFGYAF